MIAAHPRVKLDVPHRAGCNNQLIVIGADYLRRHRGLPDIQQRDSLGRRHPHAWRWWLTLICNDADCPAVVLVRTDAVEQMATQALAGGAR